MSASAATAHAIKRSRGDGRFAKSYRTAARPPPSPHAAAAASNATRQRAASDSVTETASDGSVTRKRGTDLLCSVQLMGDGEEEEEEEGKEEEEERARAAPPTDEQVAAESAHTEREAESEQHEATERRVALRAVSSSSGAVSADGGEAVCSQLMPYAPASAALPADLLPPLDPAFLPEPSALSGIDSPDVPLSDLWQACGYHSLSDLLSDNIVRASTPDSRTARRRTSGCRRWSE